MKISDHAHISTCAVINGNCKIGMGTFIGSSTVLKENIEVGSKSIIGFGKSISKNVPSGKLINNLCAGYLGSVILNLII